MPPPCPEDPARKWTENIVDVHGDAGRIWLTQLPETLAACAEKWDLELHPPFGELSYNYVAPATHDGLPVVLKAGVPSREIISEIEALRAFEGNGMVRLLNADPDLGIMLLECLQPGSILSDLDDDEEITHCAISVLKRLCRPAPDGCRFTTVSEWALRSFGVTRDELGSDYAPLPVDLIDEARGIFVELAAPAGQQFLIHGDFHPQNILRSERDDWLAIDPKGVVGDPLFDVAVFVCEGPRRPTELNREAFLARRMDQTGEELKVDRGLIAQWCLAHRVLSGCWSFQDHGDGWQPAFADARLLKRLIASG